MKRNAAPKLSLIRTPDARVSALGIAKDTAQAIERGAYLPGARLREQELADKYGCSRAPVREALRLLESQGIVVIEPMKGASVASIDDASFYEVFLIRKALAGLAAQQAARSANQLDKGTFLGAVNALARDEAAAGNAQAYGDAIRDVRAALSKLASMPRAAQIVRSMTFGHHAFADTIFESKQSRREHARLWMAVAAAVEAGNANGAREAMENIFDHALRFVRGKLPAERTQGPDERGIDRRRPTKA
jgi:DNA-binding GntR family transcriptional regulator